MSRLPARVRPFSLPAFVVRSRDAAQRLDDVSGTDTRSRHSRRPTGEPYQIRAV